MEFAPRSFHLAILAAIVAIGHNRSVVAFGRQSLPESHNRGLAPTAIAKPNIQVNLIDIPKPLAQPNDPPVLTNDLVALADLRYNEWIQADANSSSAPSRYAFRMATAEIASERAHGGALTFLAKVDREVVAAAELSPIEFESVLRKPSNHRFYYITDVVTSSQHRRLGIGNQLMDAVEAYAYSTEDTTVVLGLHVKAENLLAQAFYQNAQRGYTPPSVSLQDLLDVPKLEENAGIANENQIFLCKTLTPEIHQSLLERTRGREEDAAVAVTSLAKTKSGSGFGSSNAPTKSKTSKRKRK